MTIKAKIIEEDYNGNGEKAYKELKMRIKILRFYPIENL